MMKKLTVYAAALMGVCLVPLAAMAQNDSFDVSDVPANEQTQAAAPVSVPLNEVSLGFAWVGGTNTNLFGRYNGFTEQGFDILGDFRFQKRDPWDSGDTFYYKVTGTDLVYQTGNRLSRHFRDESFIDSTSNRLGPEAEIGIDVGNQGTWGFTADYDAISYAGNVINSIYTVNGTTGMLNNNFPAWGGASNNPLQAGPITSYTTDTLSPAEKKFQVGTRRDILQFSGHYLFEDWVFAANVRHEHKEGTLEESLRETYGGQAFTMPVDYDTDRVDVTASYNLEDFQAILQYTYSHFTDNNLAVALPYPVSIAKLTATSGPFAQTGLYSLPPSNSAHYATAMIGYNPMPQTRIVLNGRFGVELQNNIFPANSADPNLSNTLGHPTFNWFDNLNSQNQGTTANSPDATAWIYQGNATVTSNLFDDFDVKAAYAFDGRNVDLNQFQVWGDGHGPDATANQESFVVPQDWFKQTASLEANYRILPESNTRLTVGYNYNNTQRSNAQVEHSHTHSEYVELSSMIGRDVLARFTYEHSNRSGELIYGTAWGNLETGAPEEFGTPSGAYYQAPMTSNSVVARADYAPDGDFSASLFVKYANEHFHYPPVPSVAGIAPNGDWNLVGFGQGVKKDYTFTIGPDVSYRPREDMDFHLYYTYEKIFFDNRGNGACAESNTGGCAGSVGFFKNTYDSSTHTAGISANWQVNGRLKIGEEYNYQRGTIIFGEFNGVFVQNVTATYQNVIPYPDIDSEMHQLRLTADYQITPTIDWGVIYQYSRFHNNDWDFLTAPVQPSTNTGTAISILTPGYRPPEYNVSTIGTVVRVKL